MTLRITIAHGSPGYPAVAHVSASGGYSAQDLRDGNGPADRWIHSGACALVHELQPDETVDQAESRALTRMWAAYAHQAGGKTFDGKPLPTWEELGEERQACWRAALRAL
jgi:hypothetical protein